MRDLFFVQLASVASADGRVPYNDCERVIRAALKHIKKVIEQSGGVVSLPYIGGVQIVKKDKSKKLDKFMF